MPASSDGRFLQDNGAATDDSDSDADPAAGYYHQISAESDVDDGELGSATSPVQSNGYDLNHQHQRPHPNSLFSFRHAENGISCLDLDGYGGEGGEYSEEEEEEEEEERERQASISRAFREDESRRSTPLTPENAAKIVEAMRGVSFNGFAPDWVNHVPEDRWVDQLRRLRGESSSQS